MNLVTERRRRRCAVLMLVAVIGWMGQSAAAAEAQGPSRQARTALCGAAKAQQASYFDLWQREFQRRNRVGAAEMAERVQPGVQEIFCGWDDGLAWRVDYTVSFGWARVATHDELVLTLYSSTDAYGHLNLPRDQLWPPAVIVRALDAGVAVAHIQSLDLAARPAFATEAQARAQLIHQLGGLTPQRSEFRLLPLNCAKPCTPGHPTLLGHAVIDEARNQCRSAEIDLLTGHGTVRDGPCRVS